MMKRARISLPGRRARRDLALLFVGATTCAGTAWSQEMAAPSPEPTVTVAIELAPGERTSWIKAFEEHMVPSIREAIDRGELTNFDYYESVVTGQSYDVLLILQGPSFAFFDERRPYPHYAALFRRLGPTRAQNVLEEMTGLERAVSVGLSRGFEVEP